MGLALQVSKIKYLMLEFLFFILYKMEKQCKWLVISKSWLEKNYKKQFDKLNDLLGRDWYIYQYYTIYYLSVWQCETSFISLKLDLDSIIDWIQFGLLLGKHSK